MKRFCLLALVAALLLTAIPMSALAAGYLEATGARVNVRTGPGEKYEDLYTLIRGEQVDYLGQYKYDGNGVKWYKVQYYSYGTGWVSSEYSRVTDHADGLLPDFGDDSVGYAYVKAENGNVNIRKTPNLLGVDLGTIPDDEIAEFLGDTFTDDRGVEWYYVEYDGVIGWVSSRYSQLYNRAAATTRYVVAENGNVNIRRQPNLTATSLGVMYDGEYAVYMGRKSTDDRGVVWYYIDFDGTLGWVSSRYSALYN